MPMAMLQDLTVAERATFVSGSYAWLPRLIKIESFPDGDRFRCFPPDPASSFHFAPLKRKQAQPLGF